MKFLEKFRNFNFYNIKEVKNRCVIGTNIEILTLCSKNNGVNIGKTEDIPITKREVRSLIESLIRQKPDLIY